MRRPPSVSKFVNYPVTAAVAALAIGVTLLTYRAGSVDPVRMSVRAFEGQPWRLVTSALPHADVLHLAFNLYWLWVFGTLVEEVFGPVRTLVIFVVLQVGAIAAEYAILDGGIGLSGIGFGLVSMVWMLGRPRGEARFRGAADNRVLGMFGAWFVFCVVTTILDVYPVANIAHGMGFILGLLAGVALASGRPPRQRAVAAVVLAILVAASLVGASWLRPRVNLSSTGGLDHAELGYEALEAGDLHEAIVRYRAALAYDGDDTTSLYDLGIALERSGELPGALAQYRRAHALDPHDARYTAAVHAALIDAGLVAYGRSDFIGALRLYREALLVRETAITQYDLAMTYRKLGLAAESRAAWNRANELDPKVLETIRAR